MLKKIEISTFEDRIPYLTAVSKKGFYIVSDIKSKIQFQNFFLKENPQLQTDFIKRASDFYCELFKSNNPDHQIISSSQLALLFKIYIKQTNHSWLKNIPSHQKILHSLHTFLPFLTHPEGEDSFEMWMKQSSKKAGWIHWYKPTKEFWEELKKNKLIEKSLTKYLLIDQPLKNWNNPLIIDLSFSIDSVEAGVISTLSSIQDVTLLLPPKLNNPLYSKSHYIYSLIEGPYEKKSEIPHKKNFHHKQVRKFQTMLEEVRFVTEQLNFSLKNGCKPSELAVIAPDIELYWPCLKSYLKKENIPLKKGMRVSLLSFPQIQKWLSILHFYSGKISFENMTAILNLHQNTTDILQMQSKYYYCDRDKDIKDFPYLTQNKPRKFLLVDEFVDWIDHFWNAITKSQPNPKLNECLNKILHRISSSKNTSKKVSIEDWLEILENEIIQEEFHIPNTQSQGVELLSVNAITSLRAKQVFIMGLDHNSCHYSSHTFLSEQESKKILQDLGFHCLTLDPNQREYEIVHFLNSFNGSVTLSYSETSFDGKNLTPSRIWLLENTETNSQTKVSKPAQTMWTAFQQKSLKEITKNSSICSASQIEHILNQEIQWPSDQRTPIERLSPSTIKDYASCPFIFLSKNIFHLKDISYQDMDLDYKDYGQIIHELFHQIKKNNIQNKEGILNWLQSIKSKFHILSDEMWQSYSEQFLKKSFQFIEHEKTITQLLRGIKTTDTEWVFKVYWNLEKEKLDSKGDILIEGRIDRIDCFQDEYLIIDYKSSLTSNVNISYWEKNLDFQMPLYIGAVSLIKNQEDVSAALYLSYRDFKWKGFISKDSELKKIAHSSRLAIDPSKKDIILKNINKSVQKNILNLKENIFQAEPFDRKICKDCYWRNICRAPHLN